MNADERGKGEFSFMLEIAHTSLPPSNGLSAFIGVYRRFQSFNRRIQRIA
jgi:hypothetical protein